MYIPGDLLGILVGCMLAEPCSPLLWRGDAYMDNRIGRVTRFSLKQSIINFPFL